MGKTVRKIAKIVGIAALAVTGIGLFVAPAALGVLAGVSAAANAIGLTTLFSIGAAALSIGMLPGKPKMIEDTGADKRGRTFLDPNALAAFAFGRTTVPCALVFEQRHADNQTVTNVVAHTWHRIESYVSLHANGEPISFSGDDATGAWAGLLTWRRALGTQSSALNLTGTDWPNDAVGEGVAYSAFTWRYRENSEKLRGGIPLNLDVVVEGAWLYDPRLDNEYGSGSQDFDDPSTWSFNDGNAALVLLRMLIGEYDGNGRLVWGRGAQESEIDMATFVAMANVADETVDGKPRYRLGGIHLLSGNWAEFVRRWEEETGGKLYKASGLYKVWLPHDDLTPLTTITEDDLIASEEIKLAIGNLSGMYNCARGRYIEPEEGYRAFPYPEVEEGTAISDDGMRRVLYHDFAWVQDVEIAERTARQLVRRSRFPRVWGVTLGWKGLDPKYEPFTVHTLNISETGNNNQLVRVIDRSISFDGRVRLLLQQEDESIYDDTVPLGDPFQSLGVSDRLDRIETVAPRYIDGTRIDDLKPAESGASVNAPGTLAAIPNHAGDDEALLCGVTNGEPDTNKDGHIFWHGSKITIERDQWNGFTLLTQDNVAYEALVAFDTSKSSPFTVNGNPFNVAAVRKNGDQWQYDNNSAWTDFTPSASIVALGWIKKSATTIETISLFGQPVVLDLASFPRGDETAARLVNSQLINAGFELGTLEGWTSVVSGSATREVITTAPAFGTYHLRVSGGSGQSRIRNNFRLPVNEGDRVLAQGMCKRVSGTAGVARVAIRFRNDTGTLIGTAAGNGVTSTSYEQSRAIGIAPAGAVHADFEFERTAGSDTCDFDGALFGIIPRDLDIDALGTTNAPAQSGADVTGQNTALDVTPEEGSFFGTITGRSGGPSTIEIHYSRTGGVVTMWVNSAPSSNVGPSNATTMTVTGVPADLRPSTDKFGLTWGLIDESVQSGSLLGYFIMRTTGTIEFGLVTQSSISLALVPSGFGASGDNKGFYQGIPQPRMQLNYSL